jgi:hypothetical protein
VKSAPARRSRTVRRPRKISPPVRDDWDGRGTPVHRRVEELDPPLAEELADLIGARPPLEDRLADLVGLARCDRGSGCGRPRDRCARARFASDVVEILHDHFYAEDDADRVREGRRSVRKLRPRGSRRGKRLARLTVAELRERGLDLGDVARATTTRPGRPSDVVLDDLVRRLGAVYERATGRTAWDDRRTFRSVLAEVLAAVGRRRIVTRSLDWAIARNLHPAIADLTAPTTR